MDDSEFEARVDAFVEALEDAVDELDADMDVDTSGGILNIGFPDGSSVIVSRQGAIHEIWIAARSGGFHLSDQDGNWMCRATGEDLPALVNRVFSEQLGSEVSLLD